MSTSIVKSSTSVHQLRQGFVDKMDTIDTCIGLISADDECQTLLQSIKQDLYSITQTISQLRCSITQSQEQLQRGQQMLVTVGALNARVSHMRQHMPAHLPSQQQKLERPKPNFAGMAESSNDDCCGDQPQLASVKVNGKASNSTARFLYITIQEFEDVPKYVRGRLKYEQVNEMVDDLNKALTEKYALLRRPRSKLSVPDMKLVNFLRSQNNASTKDRVFVSSDDLKRWSDVKLDSTKRSMLTVLRVARKCQEIRGPASLIRYTVPNDFF
ncbi:Spindle and kinetochore-associated protein 1 [Trinorchestia longiramus]|nr:Spindle and kinetochore-associated protein 1 [Trinorchestia longiramus]